MNSQHTMLFFVILRLLSLWFVYGSRYVSVRKRLASLVFYVSPLSSVWFDTKPPITIRRHKHSPPVHSDGVLIPREHANRDGVTHREELTSWEVVKYWAQNHWPPLHWYECRDLSWDETVSETKQTYYTEKTQSTTCINHTRAHNATV